MFGFTVTNIIFQRFCSRWKCTGFMVWVFMQFSFTARSQTVEYQQMKHFGGIYNAVKVKITPELAEKTFLLNNSNQSGEKNIFDSLSKKYPYIAVNGAISHADCKPLGWWVENGVEYSGINYQDGAGNFYLKPNGFLAICGGQFILAETAETGQCYTPSWAIQSGPMLVINQRIHSGFSRDSKNKYFRNGVGISEDNGTQYLIFVQSQIPVSFYQLADLFLNRFNCTNALHLESGPQITLHLPTVNQIFSDTRKVCRYWILPVK